MAKRVHLDAGHGGRDPGAPNPHGPPHESAVCLAVCLEMERLLVDLGVEVTQSRKTDVFIAIGDRARAANRARADYFVSVHCNAAENRLATGIETFCHPTSPRGRELATAIQLAMMRRFPGHKDRGVKTANFQVIREAEMPAVLAEVEFISNLDMATWLTQPQNQRSIAAALVEGIVAHAGIEGPPPARAEPIAPQPPRSTPPALPPPPNPVGPPPPKPPPTQSFMQSLIQWITRFMQR